MIQQRQLLDGQLNENKSVLDELNRLSEDKNTVSDDLSEIFTNFRSDVNFFSLAFLGLQAHGTDPREAAAERQQDEHQQAHRLHQQGAEPMQWSNWRHREGSGQAANKLDQITATIERFVRNASLNFFIFFNKYSNALHISLYVFFTIIKCGFQHMDLFSILMRDFFSMLDILSVNVRRPHQQ